MRKAFAWARAVRFNASSLDFAFPTPGGRLGFRVERRARTSSNEMGFVAMVAVELRAGFTRGGWWGKGIDLAESSLRLAPGGGVAPARVEPEPPAATISFRAASTCCAFF